MCIIKPILKAMKLEQTGFNNLPTEVYVLVELVQPIAIEKNEPKMLNDLSEPNTKIIGETVQREFYLENSENLVNSDKELQII